MRLIDLRCNWALQYAGETTQFDPAPYAEYPKRVAQVEGYLSDVSAVVLVCGREPKDWTRQAAPWETLNEMIARYEAEFPGRLLLGPADAGRWMAEPEHAMSWGVLAIEGLDYLVREPRDVDRLEFLFRRGIRVFQVVRSGEGLLGGSDAPGDERGLSDLGRATLDRLDGLASDLPDDGPRPALDIAGLSDRAADEVLSWFETNPARASRLLLVRSYGSIRVGSSPSRGLSLENLRRLRQLGGILALSVGPPRIESPEELKAAIEAVAAAPLVDRQGYDGIAIGTDFLNLKRTVDPLENAQGVIEWLGREFPAEIAERIGHRTARHLLLRLAGFPTGTGAPQGGLVPA